MKPSYAEYMIKKFNISERIFAEVFELDNTGLISCANLPEGKMIFGEKNFLCQVNPFHPPNCSKKDLKVKFRMLTDPVSKLILAKAEDFDTVTTENFQFMAVISSNLV